MGGGGGTEGLQYRYKFLESRDIYSVFVLFSYDISFCMTLLRLLETWRNQLLPPQVVPNGPTPSGNRLILYFLPLFLFLYFFCSLLCVVYCVVLPIYLCAQLLYSLEEQKKFGEDGIKGLVRLFFLSLPSILFWFLVFLLFCQFVAFLAFF